MTDKHCNNRNDFKATSVKLATNLTVVNRTIFFDQSINNIIL